MDNLKFVLENQKYLIIFKAKILLTFFFIGKKYVHQEGLPLELEN